MWRRLFCWWRGFHVWKCERNAAKRYCTCCGRREWLFGGEYGGALVWRRMESRRPIKVGLTK